MELTKYIRDIHDFPKKGILFKDITPLLLSPEATTEALTQLCAQADGLGVTKVAAVESRGFFFGSLIAHQLGVGYVPVRKKGKLPYDTISMSYDLEYGTDELEIHTDAIKPGDKVLVHDDVLATGGTGIVPDGVKSPRRGLKTHRPERKMPHGILRNAACGNTAR